MKAYRVFWEGTDTDCEGRAYRGKDEAEYFFNKEEAEKLYNTGKYFIEEVRVWEKYKDGTFSKYYGTIGKNFIDKYLKNGDKVEIVKVEQNRFKMEEIEIN